MVTVENSGDVAEAYAEIGDVVANPATSISEFYCFWYLSEIEGVKKLEFDLKQIANKQADAMQNYGIFASGYEMRHVFQHFKLDGTKLDAALQAMDVGGTNAELQQKFNTLLSDFKKEARNKLDKDAYVIVASILDGNYPRMMTRGDKVERSEIIEAKYNAFSHPRPFLDAMDFMFGTNFQQVSDISKQSGWDPNYGGDAWSFVARTTSRRDELTPNSYVDLMWHVEHNNGAFIDKDGSVPSEEVERVRDAIKTSDRETNAVMSRSRVVNVVVPALLQEVREEKLDLAYHIAVKKHRKLREYAGRFI